MEKPRQDSWEYLLSIPHEGDAELAQIIYDDILGVAGGIADNRNCFIETDVRAVDDPDRSW